MKIVKTQHDLLQALEPYHTAHKTIGFVPTMGGLHAGHMSLVRRCTQESEVTVVSVFLNPTQFNDPNDLVTYPHNTEDDIRMLDSVGGVDIVFLPTAEEMYAPGESAPEYDLGHVAEVMEGAHRPGHFRGVVWIVSKLFRLVKPDLAFFGLKDFQQIAVIQRMVELSPDMDVKIVPCPIVREDDGLAMSSRNKKLGTEERAEAPKIYAALTNGVKAKNSGASVAEVREQVISEINGSPLLEVEYFSIVDGHTLVEINDWTESPSPVGAITVQCGPARLIDHIEFD